MWQHAPSSQANERGGCLIERGRVLSCCDTTLYQDLSPFWRAWHQTGKQTERGQTSIQGPTSPREGMHQLMMGDLWICNPFNGLSKLPFGDRFPRDGDWVTSQPLPWGTGPGCLRRRVGSRVHPDARWGRPPWAPSPRCSGTWKNKHTPGSTASGTSPRIARNTKLLILPFFPQLSCLIYSSAFFCACCQSRGGTTDHRSAEWSPHITTIVTLPLHMKVIWWAQSGKKSSRRILLFIACREALRVFFPLVFQYEISINIQLSNLRPKAEPQKAHPIIGQRNNPPHSPGHKAQNYVSREWKCDNFGQTNPRPLAKSSDLLVGEKSLGWQIINNNNNS